MMRVGAMPFETLVVQCHVDAVPEVTRFSWTYNTSKGVLPVQAAKVQNKDGISTLQFTPGTGDIESLSCWATNIIGRQEVPCLFYVVPAGKCFHFDIFRRSRSSCLEIPFGRFKIYSKFFVF